MAEDFNWRVYTFVLMGNHYHLMLETPEPTLSRGMRQLNGVYTLGFNRRHGRVGHLFQGRFKAILVERESHLLELIRYVALNPVRAGLARSPQEAAGPGNETPVARRARRVPSGTAAAERPVPSERVAPGVASSSRLAGRPRLSFLGGAPPAGSARGAIREWTLSHDASSLPFRDTGCPVEVVRTDWLE